MVIPFNPDVRHKHSFKLGNTQINLDYHDIDGRTSSDLFRLLRQAQKPSSHKLSYPRSFDFIKEHHIGLSECGYDNNGNIKYILKSTYNYIPLCGWEWLEKAWKELSSKDYKQDMIVSYDGKKVGKFNILAKAGEVKQLIKGIRTPV